MISIKPMLAVSGEIFSGKGWIFEPKIDGTRGCDPTSFIASYPAIAARDFSGDGETRPYVAGQSSLMNACCLLMALFHITRYFRAS
jgi:hypothetical protein